MRNRHRLSIVVTCLLLSSLQHGCGGRDQPDKESKGTQDEIPWEHYESTEMGFSAEFPGTPQANMSSGAPGDQSTHFNVSVSGGGLHAEVYIWGPEDPERAAESVEDMRREFDDQQTKQTLLKHSFLPDVPSVEVIHRDKRLESTSRIRAYARGGRLYRVTVVSGESDADDALKAVKSDVAERFLNSFKLLEIP